MKVVDYKATIWGRLEFDDSTDIKEITQALEQGILPAELCDIEELKFRSFHHIDNTEEFITPSENAEQPTIEIFVDGVTVWDNVSKGTNN